MLTDRQVKSLRTDLPQIEVYDGSSPRPTGHGFSGRMPARS
jgi:hypothetical protein